MAFAGTETAYRSKWTDSGELSYMPGLVHWKVCDWLRQQGLIESLNPMAQSFRLTENGRRQLEVFAR
jgi:hypothetical protein